MPTAISGSERKAQTTCAEPPGSAATSQGTSSHVFHDIPLTHAALVVPLGQNTLFTIKMEHKYDIHCELYSLCNIYI